MDGKPGDSIKGLPPLIFKTKTMSRSNTNAREEFLNAIGTNIVECATITYDACSLWEMSDEEPSQSQDILLKRGYTQEEFEQFLNKLDFKYDSGYGGQELFGTVWFENGTWMERGEYDGSEWWTIQSRPQIPKELI